MKMQMIEQKSLQSPPKPNQPEIVKLDDMDNIGDLLQFNDSETDYKIGYVRVLKPGVFESKRANLPSCSKLKV